MWIGAAAMSWNFFSLVTWAARGQYKINLFVTAAVMETLVAYLVLSVCLSRAWWTPPSPQPGIDPVRVPRQMGITVIWIASSLLAVAGNVGMSRWIEHEIDLSSKAARAQFEPQEAVSRALCEGDVEKARQALLAPDAKPDAEVIIQTCLRLDYPFNDAQRLQLVKRLPVAIEVVNWIENRASPPAAEPSCTALRKKMLENIFRLDVPSLSKVKSHGWPVNCDTSLGWPPQPTWWEALRHRPDRPSFLEDLRLMDQLGVDWRAKAAGLTYFRGADADGTMRRSSPEALLFLFEHIELTDSDRVKFRMDVMNRRFLPSHSRAQMQRLTERIGEPTREQILANPQPAMALLRGDGSSDRREILQYLERRLNRTVPPGEGTSNDPQRHWERYRLVQQELESAYGKLSEARQGDRNASKVK